MVNDPIIKVDNVSIVFNKSSEKVDSIKEYFVRMIKNQLMFEEFWALKNIDLTVQRGDALGIVGFNGSGKSTLLKIIAGVMKPTKGSVEVNGTIAPMIELGAGFDMDLSAGENIYLNGAVLGYSRKEMNEKMDSILEFAELQDFVNVPLKNYSSGMVARLGFSIATAHTPDILIVDEVLGVGDYKFQEKCQERIMKIVESGATVLFVSHSIEQVKKLCKHILWLNKGEKVMYGETEKVCEAYMKS